MVVCNKLQLDMNVRDSGVNDAYRYFEGRAVFLKEAKVLSISAIDLSVSALNCELL